MKGFVPIDIYTKPYIKAYILFKLGEKPLITLNSESISSKLYDILEHSTDEFKSRITNGRYTVKVRVYLPMTVFKHRGHCLNKTNVKNFNRFVERELKEKFYHTMDTLIDLFPSFEANLPEVRKKLGIDIESWSDDSMKKDYYRYRKDKNLPLLYNKSFAAVVPSEKSADVAF